MAFGSLKDIVLAIKLVVDRNSAQQVQQQLQSAIAQGTAPQTAQKNLSQIENSIASLTGKLEKLLVGLVTAFATRVVVNFVEESVMLFAKFDQKLQQSVAIMGRMGDSMRRDLGDVARQTAKELSMNAEEIVQGYYYLAGAGLNAAQSIKALPLAAAFAKAGMMDMKQATDFLTLAVSSLGYASKDPEKNFASMSRVADVLTLASKRSQATLEQMTAALTGKVSQSLRVFHKDVEEGAAALMVLADAGVRGTLASERLDIFMRQVTQAATSHAKAFEKYGIAVFDSSGHMRKFADISHDLTRALGGLSDRQMTMAMGELGIQQRTQASIKVFLGAEDALRRYEEMMTHAGGKTFEIADRMTHTPMEQWKKFTETIRDSRREIGENFMPAMNGFMAEFAGEEGDPHSLTGMLHQFAEGLGNSEGFLRALGAAMGWIIREPIAMLIDAFNIVADLIVGPINYGLAALGGALYSVGILAYAATSGIGNLLQMVGLDSAGQKFLDLADKINVAGEAMAKFISSRGATGTENFADIWTRLSGGGFTPQKPKVVGQKPTSRGGRTPDGMPDTDDGNGESVTERDKKDAAKRENTIKTLNDRLDAELARHTQARVDDELEKLSKLEEAYKKVYGDKIPLHIREGLKEAKAAIKQEGAAKATMDMFREEFKDGDMDDTEKIEKLQAFIDQVNKLKSSAKEGSKEWQVYTDVLEKAMKLLGKLADKAASDEQKREEKRAKEAEKAAEDRLKRIKHITDITAEHMGLAFERAFMALTSGSRRGIDALHELKNVALSALTAPLAAYAMGKAKEQMLEAGDDIALAFSMLGNPLTAGLAPALFRSAAMHGAQGTAWAAFGGGVGAATSGLSGGGAGRYTDNGRHSIDSSSPKGPDINIWIDGMDPKNPNHQKLVGEALNQYVERGGGNLKINTRR